MTDVAIPAVADDAAPNAQLALRVQDLEVSYAPTGTTRRRGRSVAPALSGVSVEIRKGETLGLVGESGSGKSTLGKAILGFLAPTSGTIDAAGFPVHTFGRKLPRAYRRAVQVVFQDPVASLNPSMTVRKLLYEPLRVHFDLGQGESNDRAIELLERVGLGERHLDRRPSEFSGGQRQRIAIARALAVQPELLVLDEPVSALDVTTQSQVINLLEDLQHEFGLSMLFIAHDLSVVRHISHRIAVMYRGTIVETGPADEVCETPVHPYTELLLASILDTDVAVQRRKREERRRISRVEGDDLCAEVGCRFVDRCPVRVPMCAEVSPTLDPVEPGREVACHVRGRDA